MSLSIGIVGLPNVGKSTLFNALTNNQVLAANYPFATIEPNTGIVPIPDERLTKLAELYSDRSETVRSDGVQGSDVKHSEAYNDSTSSEHHQSLTPQSAENTSGVIGSAEQQAGVARSPQIKPATVTFVDIAGLVKGAAEGQGLGNQFLSHIRTVDALVHVVRAFESGDVVHVEQKIDPKHDIEIINTELVLADLQTVSKWLPRLEKEAKSQPKLKDDLTHLVAVQRALNDDKPLYQTDLTTHQNLANLSHEYQTFVHQLITAKPVVYVFNVDEHDLQNPTKQAGLQTLVKPAPSLLINAQLEAELNVLDATERREMLELNGIKEPGLYALIQTAYELLGLQSFLTAGPKEVRAWTISKGATAPEAAGVIHTDFAKGFIAAEIVNYDDLIEAGTLTNARAQGRVRTEGKTYVMQPDDIVEFRFNV